LKPERQVSPLVQGKNYQRDKEAIMIIINNKQTHVKYKSKRKSGNWNYLKIIENI
jgi:hypothetical protein